MRALLIQKDVKLLLVVYETLESLRALLIQKDVKPCVASIALLTRLRALLIQKDVKLYHLGKPRLSV